jgi:hypothetical protein
MLRGLTPPQLRCCCENCKILAFDQIFVSNEVQDDLELLGDSGEVPNYEWSA